ncbi:MAG: head-tail adaptor protein [Thiotrichaceae bacterium]
MSSVFQTVDTSSYTEPFAVERPNNAGDAAGGITEDWLPKKALIWGEFRFRSATKELFANGFVGSADAVIKFHAEEESGINISDSLIIRNVRYRIEGPPTNMRLRNNESALLLTRYDTD